MFAPRSSGGSSGQLPLRLRVCPGVKYCASTPSAIVGQALRRCGDEPDMGGDLGPRSLPEPCARSCEVSGGDRRVGTLCPGEPRMDEGVSGVVGVRTRSGTVRCWADTGRGLDGRPGSWRSRRDGRGLDGREARNECGRLMTRRFAAAEDWLPRHEPVFRPTLEVSALASATGGSSSRPPKVLPDAKDWRGALRHGNLRDFSPGERRFLLP